MKIAANPKRLAQYKLRRCLSMHECCLCKQAITLNENYFDGGYSRRAHERCVMAGSVALCLDGTHGGGRQCFLPERHKGPHAFQCGRPNLSDIFPDAEEGWAEG